MQVRKGPWIRHPVHLPPRSSLEAIKRKVEQIVLFLEKLFWLYRLLHWFRNTGAKVDIRCSSLTLVIIISHFPFHWSAKIKMQKKPVEAEELLLCSNECVFFWPYLHVTFDFSQLVLDVFQRHGNYIITAVISTVVDWERARGRPPQVNSTWLRAYTWPTAFPHSIAPFPHTLFPDNGCLHQHVEVGSKP